MSKTALILLLASLLTMNGCVNWSNDVGQYRAVLDKAAPTTRPAFAAESALTLIDALRIANADNESIASSGEDYIQALAEKMRQAGTFLPTLTLAPSYTYSHIKTSPGSSNANEGTTVIGGQGSSSHASSVTANASMSASLADLSNIRSSALTVEQREQLLLDTRESVLLEVVQAYYDVLRNEKQVHVLENSVALREEQVRDQEARLKLGNARPLDLAQGQSDLAATQVSLTQARTDAANARSALARLMGVDAVSGALTDAFVAPADVSDVGTWRDAAESQRQDLLAAAKAVESARASVEAAVRAYYPSVSIDFSYFLHNDPGSSGNWSSGISANVPVFSAFQIEADIRRAWSVYRQTGLAQSLIRRVVLDDVTQAHHNLTSSRDKVRLLQVQVEAAQRAFDLADRAYRLGSESNLNRLTQQDNLLTAQLNLIDEQFSEKSHYLSLLRACGRLASVLLPSPSEL